MPSPGGYISQLYERKMCICGTGSSVPLLFLRELSFNEIKYVYDLKNSMDRRPWWVQSIGSQRVGPN